MMEERARAWVASIVLMMMALGRSAVLALPHEVIPMPRTTDALSLALYVKSSEGI